MAKRMRMNDEAAITQIISDFGQWLRSLTTFDKASYEPKTAKVDARATLYFTEVAWAKMQYLVAAYDSEVAWHGTVKRVEAGKSDFVVTDIFVYPQEVTGATVNTDQKGYREWMYGTEDDPDSGLPDEIFNNLKFHGHSHVRMDTSPSPTDLEHQQSLVSQLDNDMFYIFIIMNKDNKRTVMIHDKAANTLFETEDVDVKVIRDENVGFLKLMKDAGDMIKKKSYTSGGYYANGVWHPNSAATTTKTTTQAATAATASAATKTASAVTAGVRADGVQSGYCWRDGQWEYDY